MAGHVSRLEASPFVAPGAAIPSRAGTLIAGVFIAASFAARVVALMPCL
jgi:hypothetical protein